MKLGTIAHLQFPISAFLFLVRDGTALPVNILTMIVADVGNGFVVLVNGCVLGVDVG